MLKRILQTVLTIGLLYSAVGAEPPDLVVRAFQNIPSAMEPWHFTLTCQTGDTRMSMRFDAVAVSWHAEEHVRLVPGNRCAEVAQSLQHPESEIISFPYGFSLRDIADPSSFQPIGEQDELFVFKFTPVFKGDDVPPGLTGMAYISQAGHLRRLVFESAQPFSPEQSITIDSYRNEMIFSRFGLPNVTFVQQEIETLTGKMGWFGSFKERMVITYSDFVRATR